MGFAAEGAIRGERFVDGAYRLRIESDYAGLMREVKQMLDSDGLATLEGFIDPAFLEELRSSVRELTPKSYEGGTRRPLLKDLEGTIFYEVTYSAFLVGFVNDLLADLEIQLEPHDGYPVVNIAIGEKGQDQVRAWHFDATYLTIVMPVIVPRAGSEGDGKFRIWPNVRGFSQNKLLDRIYWNLAKWPYLRRRVRNLAINLIPGNLYLFYGFRCYHGVDELDPNQLRAVCLMNYGGPLFDRLKGKRMRYRSGRR